MNGAKSVTLPGGFQSISFPSEWGPRSYTRYTAPPLHRPVSNLLASPASGDLQSAVRRIPLKSQFPIY